VIAELIQALESDPHDAVDHQGEDATATHLVEQAIDELDAVLSEEPSHESEDWSFATHFLSGAFSTPVVDSPIAFTPSTGTHVSDRRESTEFTLDVSRAYLVKEAKRFSKPGFLVDIGAPKSVIGKKALNRVFSSSKAYQLPKLRSSPHSFRFAKETFPSIGSMTL